MIAVVNRKGGSGKSTLATHVAVWMSRRGEKVMLGDVDRQRSTVPWLRRRAAQVVPGEPLQGWATDPRNVLRPPSGVRHVVLDTPGGMQGFDLGRVAMYADILLLPLCDSLFDRESAAGCLEELRAHPRVSSGRVQVGVVGMRLDWSGYAEGRLREWAGGLAVPMVAAVRDSRAFVSAAERGLTVLDLPEEQTPSERKELSALFDWIDGAIAAIPLPTVTRPVQSRPAGGAQLIGVVDQASQAAQSAASAAALERPAPRAASVGDGPAVPTTEAGAAGTPQDEGIPISLIQIGARPSGALSQLRRWFGRLRSGS
ncbi:MAG: ParA family protein [Rubrivivax sp.]|nr:ParA family protein [Rubrivivax sp.]